ncbi:MAG: hypothetical protein AAGA48_16270 [Myxococcota bacterium]
MASEAGPLGSAATWVRDATVGAVLLTAQFLLVLAGFLRPITTAGFVDRMTDPTLLSNGLIGMHIAAFIGAGLALPMRGLAALTARAHVGLACAWGPFWGALAAVAIVYLTESLSNPSASLQATAWSKVAMLGSGTTIFAWPVYVILRYRGRGGWPALFVASITMTIPVAVLVLW